MRVSIMRQSHIISVLICLILAFFSHDAKAQATYNMSDAYVTDCEGILMDSEMGPEEGQYNHNEDYTFTICIEGATEILMLFEFFATELTYDVLTIYDGPDTNSPILAELTGVIQPGPVVVATSGCMTLHFVSDDNIVATGWLAEWSIEIEEPVEPELSIESEIMCPLNSAIFSFDYPIDCSNFDPANFSIVGPGGSTISNINVLDCDPNTGLGQTFEVFFDGPLSQEGSYRLIYNISVQDACDEWHDISASILFDLANCPFNVIVEISDHGCEGSCGMLYANIIGGGSSNYTFEWSHTALDQQEVEICTDTDTLIELTVTDPATNQSVTTDFLYQPLENPVFLNPLFPDTICAGQPNHQYNVSLWGGEFYSRVIPNWHRTDGVYEFWRWWNAPGVEQDVVTYYAPNGCSVTDTFWILPISAGSPEAACLGADPFVVNGGTPVGGVWSGPHIDPDGTFNPDEVGSFVVSYEAPNGCVRNKRVNVTSEIVMPDIDTICNTNRHFLEAEPFGGRWSGPGIINNINGRLDPWTVPGNTSYTYYYDLNGCRDSMEIYIQALWAGPDYQVCSETEFITMNQSGNWSGPGIYNPVDSTFDISSLAPGYYEFQIVEGPCSDRFGVEIITPAITVNNNLFFCLVDQWYSIFDFISIYPDYGSFSGAQVVENSDNWYINPSVVGPGIHTLYFETLGCRDSVTIEVEAPADIPDYVICELDPITQLEADPAGGTWSGPGFIDPQTGLYDPALVGPGIYNISYFAPSGCETQTSIEIFPFEEVSISGLIPQYCYQDTLIILDVQPAGGQFLINDVPSSPQFNPVLLGEGNHEIVYTRGSGACESTERQFVTILPPISGVLNASNDSICLGQNTVIDIETGGGAGTLSATWNQGLGFGTSHIINPQSSTWYQVTVEDGCSEPLVDSLFVLVFQPFSIDQNQGPEVCYEESTYVEIVVSDPSNYIIEWQTNPPIISDRLDDLPGFYTVEVTEISSGCSQEFEVQLPGAEPMQANFSINPNQECIDNIDNEIEIIDLATGYTEGWIDFGDGSQPVALGQGVISHEYDQIGDFVITQFVTNEIGCTDTLTANLCVENKIQFYVPNAFSPNGDDVNDLFMINAFGVIDPHWSIYDRWGNRVFESFSLDEGWDGTFNGQVLQDGVYVIRFSYTDPVTGRRYTHGSSVTILK